MIISEIYAIFQQAIVSYHIEDQIDAAYSKVSFFDDLQNILHHKAWIDTVQWHTEDHVRDTTISADSVRLLKQKIDQLNQTRTNLVEQIDSMLYDLLIPAAAGPSIHMNTESPGWALDRLSILALKIYHMQIEVTRTDLPDDKKSNYLAKYELLTKQKTELISSIQSFVDDVKMQKASYHLYRQVKMYNDQDLNPVLRKNK